MRPQLAHSAVHITSPMASSNNLGATHWGFQQISPRYGVCTLDAPTATSVQLLQLARRNLRPIVGSQRPERGHSVPVHQPPLAMASQGSSNDWHSAESSRREAPKA